MGRFYLRPVLLVLLVVALVIVTSSWVAGQTATLPEQPLLGWTLTADIVRDLPTGGNPYALLDTVQDEAIGDRFVAGGLNVAEASRFGGFLNSWTQTQFRMGDVPITDPRAGGTPLLLPRLPFWERLTIETGMMGVDQSAPALSMTLEPPRPGATWFRAFEGSFSGSGLVADGDGGVPAVDRVHNWQDGSAFVSGPLTDRAGIVAAGSWQGLSHVEAPATTAARDYLASGFAHLVFAATARDEVRALGWVQRASTDAFDDTGVHLQSTWERRGFAQATWRAFGGFTQRKRTTPVVSALVVDSLTSDPITDLIDTGAGTARRVTLGARVTPTGARPLPALGIDLDHSEVRVTPSGISQISELVDGVPSRLWTWHTGTGTDSRSLTTWAVHANEHVTSGRLTLDAGIRLDATTTGIDAGNSAIGWTTWLPRAMVSWQLVKNPGIELIAGYRRSAYQLPLNVLAVGNPAAPFADVSLWNGAAAGSLIARVGPGTGGDATLAQIDPALKRPVTDELVLAVRARLRPGLQLELARVTKREEPLLTVVDTGVPFSTYSTLLVRDPSVVPELPGPFDTLFVTAYNRPAGTYGLDRYLLTNQVDEKAQSWGLQFTVRASTERLILLAATALTWARANAAAIGFLPTENDQDVLGNLFVDANAASHAYGQLFQDRSHVGKFAVVYRFPRDIHFGTTLRYQDGQPFSRLVVVPDLTQGRTAIRSYRNGGSAFTFTATMDIRLQKIFKTTRGEVAVGMDVYNLPNLDYEVSEYVVSGPRFRTPTLVQPPRTILASARVTF